MHFLGDSTTLDVEPHRIIFLAGEIYELDLRLDSQGRLSAVPGHSTDDVLPPVLPRKDLKPDTAAAEWRAREKALVVNIDW